jgi:hypothetical protein
MTGRGRRALLAAATVVLLLAFGPFASPLVGDAPIGATPVDHRNDLPVVQPARSASAVPTPASRGPSSRSVLVVVLVAALGVAIAQVVRRRTDTLLEPHSPRLWASPPRRGPPLLAAG